MSRKKRKRKQPGHFCWACGRRRPNESFSGRGHVCHVCRDCSKLGAAELAYRQALRDLDRCMTWEGIIPRKRRKSFEQFLDHKDPRIRARAKEMLEEDRAERAYQRSMRESDEAVSGSPNKSYGVLGLADPLEEVIGPSLPRLVTTVLLPFRGKIIYDGLVSGYNITFGGGIKRTLNEEYKRAKEAFGIITSLGDDMASAAKPPKKSKQRPRKTVAVVGGRSASEEAKAVAGALVQMTDAFCREFLNEEYAELCRKLATALARKRPSPLLRGRLETWASGVVRTIGWANFLHDPSQTPHLKLYSIDEAFGIAESTGAAKLKTIRNLFRIRQFDPKWTLPSKMDDNPMVWMLEVNGFLMDIRRAPRELQEVAFQKKLIPYIPAYRAKSDEET